MKLKLISDGTNLGTNLINIETGERIQNISKITYEANVEDPCTKVVVELTNLPVELDCKANILETDIYTNQSNSKSSTIKIKSFEKHTAYTTEINNLESTTHEKVGGIQNINFCATPTSQTLKIKKIKI